MRLRAATLLLLAAVACHEEKEPPVVRAVPKPLAADALYARGREALQRGDIKAAERDAHEGEQRFAAQSSWHELFAILDAEANPDHGKPQLEQAPATGTPEAVVRRAMLSREYDKADETAARQLPALQPEIAAARARQAAGAGRFDDATRYAQIVLTTARHDWLLMSGYGQLGYVAMKQSRWPEAIDNFNRTLEYARALRATPTEIRSTTNLGWCYLASGDFDNALKYSRSGAEQQMLLDWRHTALINIAEVYERRLEFSAAMSYAQKGLLVADMTRDNVRIANSYHQLGQIEFERGNFKDANQWTAQALKTRPPTDTEGVLSDRWMEARIVAKADPVHAFAMLDSLLASKEARGNLPWRWRIQQIEAEILYSLGKIPEAKQKYKETLDTGANAREKVQGSASAFAFERNLLSVYDGYIDLLLTEGRKADALAIAERSRARALREELGERMARSVDPVALARQTDATILCYWLYAKRSLLWIVTPHGIDVQRLAAEDEIDKLADDYRGELQRARFSPDTTKIGVQLYEMIVAPAKIAPASRVIILPDAHLRALSFDALIVPQPKRHYWIEDVTISYSPSLYLLASAPTWKGIGAGRALVFGNVPAEGPEFPKLAQAQREIDDIARRFGTSAVIVSGAGATPASYAAAHPKDYQVIHFAAHAVAPPESPMSSAVILARDTTNNFRLEGRQIIRVPLAAELVTLSSCNSAGRRNFAGEGLVGLTWAFLGAGAHRVVAAQWEVSDSAAPKIMDSMYAAIRSGVEPAKALRRAKLELLNSGRVFARPLYWAPFAIYGAL